MSNLADRISKLRYSVLADFTITPEAFDAILADARELERNDARYRWLRSQDTGPHELDQSLFETINDDCHPPYRSMKHGVDLDAAIDAAITKTKGDSHG